MRPLVITAIIGVDIGAGRRPVGAENWMAFCGDDGHLRGRPRVPASRVSLQVARLRAFGQDGAHFFHRSDPLCGCAGTQFDEIQHPRKVVSEVAGEDRLVVGHAIT